MVNWKKHFNDGRKLQEWLARRCLRKMDGLRDMILPVTVCACGYAHQFPCEKFTSRLIALEVMKEQSFFCLSILSLVWTFCADPRQRLNGWNCRMGSQSKFASGKSMNFIRAIDGTETSRVGQIVWMKILHFFWGTVPRDSKTHLNALHQPSRCQVQHQQHQNWWEAPRNTLIYWANRIWGTSTFQGVSWDYLGVLEIHRLTKKGVSHRLAPRMAQTWVDLFRNSVQ